MAEHTPGPWVYDDDTATVDNELGVFVAGINVDLHNYEANGRLIAAAPELLEALRAFAAGTARALGAGQVDVVRARRAIFKAEGR